MNYSKITQNDKVVRLLIQRAIIEKEIQKLDDKALINYELEKLAEPQANGADTRTELALPIQNVSGSAYRDALIKKTESMENFAKGQFKTDYYEGVIVAMRNMRANITNLYKTHYR